MKHLPRNAMPILVAVVVLGLAAGSMMAAPRGGDGSGGGPAFRGRMERSGAPPEPGRGLPRGPVHPGPGFGHPGPGVFPCLRHLELAEDQQAAVEALVEADRTAAEERREALRDAQVQYQQRVFAEDLDEEALAAAEASITALLLDESSARFALNRGLRDILDAEDLAALAECLANPPLPPPPGFGGGPRGPHQP